MSRRKSRIAPRATFTAAPAPVPAPADVASILSQLVLALTSAAPAATPAPAAELAQPAVAPDVTVKAIAAVRRRKTKRTQRRAPAAPAGAQRPITVPTDDSLRKLWAPIASSSVGRPWARLVAVRYDSRVNRFRSPSTNEHRRAGGFPSFLQPVTAVLATAPVMARLAQLGLAKRNVASLMLRNAHAGVELAIHDAAGRLAVDARALDGGDLADGTAYRAARLAVVNLLNALLLTA